MAVVSAIFKSILPVTILPQITPPKDIYSLEFTDNLGKQRSFSEWKDKNIMLVNTASKCGFTYQYEGLQQLAEKYKNELQIIGFPCNQFKKQEPKSDKEIAEFCEMQFGIRFPLSQKIEVFGENQHPIYQWLCHKEQNGILDSTIEWNFQKYWIDKTGALRAVFYTNKKPNSKSFLKTVEQLVHEK